MLSCRARCARIEIVVMCVQPVPFTVSLLIPRVLRASVSGTPVSDAYPSHSGWRSFLQGDDLAPLRLGPHVQVFPCVLKHALTALDAVSASSMEPKSSWSIAAKSLAAAFLIAILHGSTDPATEQPLCSV